MLTRMAVISLYRTGKTISSIQSTLQERKSFVEKWINHWKEHKHVDDLPRQGRPHKLSNADVQKIKRRMTSKKGSSTRKLAPEFGVSKNTINRTIQNRTDLVPRRKVRKPFLSPNFNWYHSNSS